MPSESEANEHKYDSDHPSADPLPTAESSDEEKGDVPDGEEDDELDGGDATNFAGADSEHEEDAAELNPEASSDQDGAEPHDEEDDYVAPPSDDDSDAPRSRRTSRQPPRTPTKNAAATKAARAAIQKIKSGAAAASPKVKAVPKSPAANAAGSPVKKWIAPIGSSTFTSAGGKVSTTAKQYNIRVIVDGDMSSAMNGASRVTRKTIIAANIDTGKPMVLVGYGDDASKYMVNLRYGEYYTLELESKAQTLGKPLCIPDHTHYFKIAGGTKIRPYVVDPTPQSDFDSMDNTERLCVPIHAVLDSKPDDLVNVYGIVMKVTAQPMRNGTGLKVILSDATAYVHVMFFEPKANIVVGVSMVLVGAKVWTNTRTQSTELSVYNTTVVMTNQLKLPKPLIKMCHQQDYGKVVNVSAVPSQEPRTMHSLKEEAAGLAHESDKVSGTVLLHLDAGRPTNNGSINYNGCVKCKRKVGPVLRADGSGRAETDADGNTFFDHEVDRGESHKALTYNSHFLFNGRFKEDDDDGAFYLAQVDDTLGEAIFGVTSNVMSEMDEDDRTAVMHKATSTSFKFNITMIKGGEIASMIMV